MVILPYKSIQSCVQAADFGISFEQKDQTSFIVKTYTEEYTLDTVAFEETVLPFFTEACSFIELARNQAYTSEKTGLIFEMTSLEKFLSSPISSEAKKIIEALVSKVYTSNSSLKRKLKRCSENQKQLFMLCSWTKLIS